jgi:hypothetical protein
MFRVIILLTVLTTSVFAHQFALTAGYANSASPHVGSGISQSNKPFRAGGGYAVGAHFDIDKPDLPVRFGPAFLYWNNLTGDPDPNADATYFQIELGGRVSLRSRSIPVVYAGGGAGYTFSHGKKVGKYVANDQEFDGDFPTGSLHIGAESPAQNDALRLAAELSYHFGLDDPRGPLSVGPANAFIMQIGFSFHVRSPGEP